MVMHQSRELWGGVRQCIATEQRHARRLHNLIFETVGGSVREHGGNLCVQVLYYCTGVIFVCIRGSSLGFEGPLPDHDHQCKLRLTRLRLMLAKAQIQIQIQLRIQIQVQAQAQA